MRPPMRRARIGTLVKRAQIIASYKVNGNVSETAKETNSTRVTVRKWLKRHAAGSTHGLLAVPMTGRPSKKAVLLANPDALYLLREAVHIKLKIPAMMKILLERTGISIGKVCLAEFLNTHLAASRKHRIMLLSPRRPHRRRWIFQQDNAPAHKDKRSMEWIRNQSVFEVMD